MRKAAFLDRDGTINVDTGYCYKVEDFNFLPNVVTGLKKIQELGYHLILASNQSGIGRGYYTERDMHDLHSYMKSELRKRGVDILNIYFCPHHPEARIEEFRKVCDCRKPECGMLLRGAHDFSLDISSCYMIGDKASDITAGKSAGARTIFVGKGGSDADYTAIDLVEAARYMENAGF